MCISYTAAAEDRTFVSSLHHCWTMFSFNHFVLHKLNSPKSDEAGTPMILWRVLKI